MATRMVTVTSARPLAAAPSRADKKLALAAAGAVTAAHAGDERGVALQLRDLNPYQVARLFMILAAAADRDAVLFAAGFGDYSNLVELHRQAKVLRREGLTAGQMPLHVVQGERMYRRLSRRAWRQRQHGG